MKICFNILLIVIILNSCKSTEKIKADETFPKDVSLRPVHDHDNHEDSANTSPENIQKKLISLKKDIDSLIGLNICKNVSEWDITAFGAKPCGGPASYIAYPKKIEKDILDKVKKYNSKSIEYNKLMKLNSDCTLVEPPKEMRCENGKIILIQ